MKKLLSILLAAILLFSVIAPTAMAVEFSANLSVSGAIPELYSGKDGEIKFNLKNLSIFAGYDITLALKTTESLFTTGSIVNKIDIGTMMSQSEKDFIIPVKMFDTVKTGYYNISLEFTCKDRTGEAYVLSETITIHVNGQDKVDPNAPDLRISAASLDKNTPGEDNLVNMTVGIANEGKGKATGVKVVLSELSPTGFSLYKDYSPKVIGTLNAGTSGSVTFPLYVGSAITTGNQSVKAVIEYIDQNNEKKTVETSFFVYINRPVKKDDPATDGKTPIPRVIIGKYSLDTDTVNAGKNFNLTFSLKNTSTTQTVKNMAVSISSTDGVFLPVSGTSSFYINSIAPGGSYEMNIDLTPKRDSETKSYPVIIHVDYEDIKANTYSVDQSISIPVNQEQKLELGQINCNAYAVGAPANINFQYYNKGKALLYNTTVKVEGPFTFENGDIFIGNIAASSSDYVDDNVIPSEAGDLTGTIVMEYEDVNGNKKELRQDFSVMVQDASQTVEPGFDDPGMIDPEIDPGMKSGLSIWAYIAIGAGIITALIIVIVVIKKKKKAKEMVDDE